MWDKLMLLSMRNRLLVYKELWYNENSSDDVLIKIANVAVDLIAMK
jgi:hypothetical protein